MSQVEKNNMRVLTVYQYFDYSVFVRDGLKVEEKYCGNSKPMFGAITENTEDVEKIVKAIKNLVRSKTLSDVVMTIVYQMVMPMESYNHLREIFSTLSEEDVILQIFKLNLYRKDSMIVRGAFPLVFQERVSIDKMLS